jgi:hypothetical protein
MQSSMVREADQQLLGMEVGEAGNPTTLIMQLAESWLWSGD